MSRVAPQNIERGHQIGDQSNSMNENVATPNIVETMQINTAAVALPESNFIAIPITNDNDESVNNQTQFTRQTLKPTQPSQLSAIINFIKTSFRHNTQNHLDNCVKKSTNSNDNKQKIISTNQSATIGQTVGVLNTSTSSDSTLSSNGGNNSSNSNEIFCRFCQELEPENELVSPCLCCGTLKYIHQSCLQRWIKAQDNRFCELCKYEFHMKITTKPFKEWKSLDMNVMERRKIICSVTFHIIALTCVIWSLYVLIERTTEEMRNGLLEWPFWTKLIVVAIGFVGGVVFMYVQCRMYVALCRKWHDFNRTFIVQNISPTELEAAQAERLKAQSHQQIQKQARSLRSGGGDINSSTVAINSSSTHMDGVNSSNIVPAPLATDANQDFNLSVSSQNYLSDSNNNNNNNNNSLALRNEVNL